MSFKFDPRVWAGSIVLILMALLGSLLFKSALFFWIFLGLFLFHFFFFRIPDPKIPEGESPLAPAFGVVTDIVNVPEGRYLKEEAVRIGIFLSIFDPHITRSPVDGTIRFQKHEPGKFINALKPECSEVNESNWIGIEGKQKMVVRQIAGMIARRIYSDVQLGQQVSRGQKTGIICYSSRVECFLPRKSFQPQVKIGDKVRAGETILGKWIL